MATIKSFSDLQQSKKLAEILPIESADMHWQDASKEYENPYGIYDRHFRLVAGNSSKIINNKHDFRKGFILPAWSLAALLEILKLHFERFEIDVRADNKYNIFAMKGDFIFRSFDEFPEGIDNIVDICYELVIRLNKLNLL